MLWALLVEYVSGPKYDTGIGQCTLEKLHSADRDRKSGNDLVRLETMQRDEVLVVLQRAGDDAVLFASPSVVLPEERQKA
jgi:hypothetical protein